MQWGIISSETMEVIINQLLFSDSRYVTLSETKWTIRNTLAEHLDAAQLVFLDLVLYRKEDELPSH
jgi:Smg protein